MPSLKASKPGLARIKQARKEKGWTVDDAKWLEEASRVLDPSWEKTGVFASGISESTWKRFLAGKQPINAEAFIAYCQVLGLDWSKVVERIGHQDWGEAPDVSFFFGRTIELATLEQWIVQDNCRMVVLLGMGGMGKTALAAKLAQMLQSDFEYVIWRSLRNAPPAEEILAELIQFLSNQQETNLPTNLDGRILRLLNYLRSSRCLLVLDNAESILQAGERAGRYRDGYQGYGQLLKCFGETHHNSCLVLTSREKPQGLAELESETLPVRCLQLKGLPEAEGRKIFSDKGEFTGSENEWNSVISRYAGNPLALKIVASAVRDYFDSNLFNFLEILNKGTFIFDDIRDLLERQFQRLSQLEQEIMYWLAINREPVLFEELQEDFVSPISASELLQVLASLQRRSLIEKNNAQFTQQPVVMEYMITRLIEQICAEIIGLKVECLKVESSNQLANLQPTNLQLFRSHALIKAQAKDYVRETQIRLILQPVIDRLIASLSDPKFIEICLAQLLDLLRGKSPQQTGYVGGNIINLLRQLHVDLSGYDFSNLTVWQAYLQGLNLHNVNFANSDLRQSVFSEILGGLISVALSQDGKLLATGNADRHIRLWQVRTGQQLLTLKGHTNWVRSVAFSADGKFLVSGSADQTVRLWDIRDGTCLKTFTGHTNQVYSVAFSPDGQTLASGSTDQTVRLWDVRDRKCLKTFTGHTEQLRAVAFSPDGKILATGSFDQTVRLWDVRQGKCLKTFTGHSSGVHSLAFSPDGYTLVSSSADQTVRLWDVRDGTCLKTFTEHTNQVYSVAFSFDGQTLASGSADQTVRLWDVRHGTCLKTFTEHSSGIHSLAFSLNSQILASGSFDQTVKLWDVRDGKCLKTWHGYMNEVWSVAFSPDSQILASGSFDQTVRLWDVRDGKCLKTFTEDTHPIYSVVFSPDGQTLASGSTDQTVRLWDVRNGKCLKTFTGHSSGVRSLAFSPDGQTLASGSTDQTVRLWDVLNGECLKTFTGHTNQVYSVAFSPDGQTLASSSADQTVRLWDVLNGECLKTFTGHTNQVYSVAFSPDGQTLASGSADQTVRLWDVRDGKYLKTFAGHTNWVFSVAYAPSVGCANSPQGTLASASLDHTVKFWDVATGSCLRTCTGHTDQVRSVAFSPVRVSEAIATLGASAFSVGEAFSEGVGVGQTLASGGADQTVRLWNVNTGECLQMLKATRLYEGMNITGAKGLTEAQIATLKALGAIENGE